MSDGQKKFLIWVGIILLVAYLADVKLGSLIGNAMHSLQTIHNQNAHP